MQDSQKQAVNENKKFSNHSNSNKFEGFESRISQEIKCRK